jgi:ABC-type dipeptide/oligopeptide/nickel transport system permease component
MPGSFLTRLFWSFVTLLGTALLTFLLVNVVPGDVARVIAGPKATPEVLQQIRERYHLHEPFGNGRFITSASLPVAIWAIHSLPSNPWSTPSGHDWEPPPR